MKHTEETKQKIRNSAYHQNLKGENNPFFGKTHDEETIKKIINSDGFKNRKIVPVIFTDEVLNKMRKPRPTITGINNYRYRKDVKNDNKYRRDAISWCRENGGIPDEIIKLWMNPCQICGWDKDRCELHHIIPRKLGGESTLQNLMIICPNCHKLEHKKWNEIHNVERNFMYARNGNKNAVGNKTRNI